MGNEDQEQSSVDQGSSCNLTTPKICYYKYDSNNIYMQATFIRALDLWSLQYYESRGQPEHPFFLSLVCWRAQQKVRAGSEHPLHRVSTKVKSTCTRSWVTRARTSCVADPSGKWRKVLKCRWSAPSSSPWRVINGGVYTQGSEDLRVKWCSCWITRVFLRHRMLRCTLGWPEVMSSDKSRGMILLIEINTTLLDQNRGGHVDLVSKAPIRHSGHARDPYVALPGRTTRNNFEKFTTFLPCP